MVYKQSPLSVHLTGMYNREIKTVGSSWTWVTLKACDPWVCAFSEL